MHEVIAYFDRLKIRHVYINCILICTIGNLQTTKQLS